MNGGYFGLSGGVKIYVVGLLLMVWFNLILFFFVKFKAGYDDSKRNLGEYLRWSFQALGRRRSSREVICLT